MSQVRVLGVSLSQVCVLGRTLSAVSRAALLDIELRYVADDDVVVATTLGEVDEARLAGGRPVRLPRSRAGHRHYCGLFWSATMATHVVYESRLELDRLWLADFDMDVVRIAAQPMWLCGREGSTLRRHVPDLLLRRRDGGVLVVDVKPTQFLEVPEVASVLAWTGRACRAKGWEYQVWSGAARTFLANVRYLGRTRRPDVVPVEAVAWLGQMDPRGRSWAEIVGSAPQRLPREAVGAAVCLLLWRGSWRSEMSQPLDGDSCLHLNSVRS